LGTRATNVARSVSIVTGACSQELMMSHNTFGGMAVLALGMTCGVAFGQEADVGASASFGVGADANASLESSEASTHAEGDASSTEQAEPMPEPQAAATTSVYPATEPTSSHEWMRQLLPSDGMVELGLAVGVLFISHRHNFQDERLPHQKLDPAPEAALRVAYFPIRFAGLEAEGAIGTSQTEDGASATPWALRGAVVGQVPLWRITPFGLFGFGRMGDDNAPMGSDDDPLCYLGAGAKMFLADLVALRFDLRDNLTQRNGSTDGMLTHSVELLFGASLTLGRSTPPPDAPSGY
jgi:OOP family OmpA-OmpF porin